MFVNVRYVVAVTYWI